MRGAEELVEALRRNLLPGARNAGHKAKEDTLAGIPRAVEKELNMIGRDIKLRNREAYTTETIFFKQQQHYVLFPKHDRPKM